MHIDCNRFRSRRTQQRNGLIHQIGNIHHLARRRAPPAEGQNPLDQILRAVASTPNLVEAGSDIFVSRGVQQGESGVPEDRRQDIVEIVRHTARQRAKGSAFETVEVAPALNVLGPACAWVTSRDPNKRTLLSLSWNSPSVRCFHATSSTHFHRGASARLETKWIRADDESISANHFLALMARSNSPTLGHPKFPQAGPPDYDDSGATAMRAAASLRR